MLIRSRVALLLRVATNEPWRLQSGSKCSLPSLISRLGGRRNESHIDTTLLPLTIKLTDKQQHQQQKVEDKTKRRHSYSNSTQTGRRVCTHTRFPDFSATNITFLVDTVISHRLLPSSLLLLLRANLFALLTSSHSSSRWFYFYITWVAGLTA